MALKKEIPLIQVRPQIEYEPDYQNMIDEAPTPRWTSKATLILKDATIIFIIYLKSPNAAEYCNIYLKNLLEQAIQEKRLKLFQDIRSKLKLLRKNIRDEFNNDFIVSSTHIILND